MTTQMTQQEDIEQIRYDGKMIGKIEIESELVGSARRGAYVGNFFFLEVCVAERKCRELR